MGETETENQNSASNRIVLEMRDYLKYELINSPTEYNNQYKTLQFNNLFTQGVEPGPN